MVVGFKLFLFMRSYLKLIIIFLLNKTNSSSNIESQYFIVFNNEVKEIMNIELPKKVNYEG